MNDTSQALQTWVTLKHPPFAEGGKNIAFLACASEFDPSREFFIVLFFHGFDKSIETQVEKHDLAGQVARSRRNCVLVCPRISLNDNSGDNPGLFRDKKQVKGFLDELPEHIVELTERNDLATVQGMAAKAPLVLATFSGGHSMASKLLLHEVSKARTECCAFFDSLYESDHYYREPRKVLETASLVGILAARYDKGAQSRNNRKELEDRLVGQKITVERSLDKVKKLSVGVAVLQSVDHNEHWDIVSRDSPLQKVLSKFAAKGGQTHELPPPPSA